MNDNDFFYLGEDLGMGANKLYGAPGGLQLLSQVASHGAQQLLNTTGLRQRQRPLEIKTEHGSFYVGEGAHDFGRPVENLDVDRFNGTPEMKALLYGSLTRYQQQYGAIGQPLSVAVGLPNEVLTGEQAEQNVENVKRWLRAGQLDLREALPLTIKAVKQTASAPKKREQFTLQRAVQRILQRYAQEAGLDELTPHILRHNFTKNLVNQGVGLEKIASLLGHANLNTTRIYITPDARDLESAVEKLK